jgi:GT2 family glycosyltransferase
MPQTDTLQDLDQVTIIIVTYNSAHCLQAQVPLLSGAAHVMLVDNSSRDDTVATARALLPHAQIIENTANRGFGAANNLALRQVKTPFALLLSPDCNLSPEALGRLVNFANANPETAIVAPQIVDPKGRPDLNYRWPNFSWKAKGPAAEGPCCVGFACGACLLLNMVQMEHVGFFDESFFLYYEDDDLCTRAFLQHRPIVVVPDALAVHASRGSVGGQFRWRSEYLRGFHHAQSKVLYAKKYRGETAASRLRWRVWAAALLLIPIRVVFFSPPLIARLAGRIAGLWQFKSRQAIIK